MENSTFEKLYKETENHLSSKKYLYKPLVPLKHKDGPKKGESKKDRYGNILYKNISPTPHKRIILSLAFNMAYENFQKIRGKSKVEELKSITDVSDMLLRYFSNKYYKNIDSIKVENRLLDINQNRETKEIENFKKIEYKLYGTIERLRNYHSHYIHEPGILTFSDLFEADKTLTSADFSAAKDWFKKRFEDVHNHMTSSLKKRKKLLEKPEDTTLNKEKLPQIQWALNDFEEIKFFNEDGSTISLDGQLFIACMFLYKRQAALVLDKWRNVKEPVGYGNTKVTFFTYYCLSESYSINNYNDNLLKFRDITSKLSTVPYVPNPKLEFIYKKIEELNNVTYEEIKKIEDNPRSVIRKKEAIEEKETLKNNIEEALKIHKTNSLKKQLNSVEEEIKNLTDELPEGLLKKIIPIRKRHIFSSVLLRYLLDNKLFPEEFEIAVKKSPTDRLKYYEAYDIINEDESLTALKNRIKEADTDKEKEAIRVHFKTLKQNFIFKKPSEITENNFTLKKKNVLIRYSHKNGVSQITLSPQLLMKWVFLDVISENGKRKVWKKENKADEYEYESKGGEIIKNFIDQYITNLSKKDINLENFLENYYKDHRNKRLKGKIFPKSFKDIREIEHGKNQPTKSEKIKNHIEGKLKQLKVFQHTNTLQAKPWKYASKKKIDVILNYMHFKLLHEVHKNNLNEKEDVNDFLRHNYFNIDTYNIAYEYLRFFGRYQNNTLDAEINTVTIDAVETLKFQYDHCFGYIEKEIEKADGLESLFEKVIQKHITDYEKLQQTFSEYTEEQLCPILKIDSESAMEDVNKLLNETNHYTHSFALSPDIISIEEQMTIQWQEFKKEKEEKLNGKRFMFSEYAFIRQCLEEPMVKTNIDYILTHIVPATGIQKIPGYTFQQLLQLKTEELILWKIAKHYWAKANEGKDYILPEDAETEQSSNYQEYTYFNKVYAQTLDYKMVIGEEFWKYKKGMPDNKKKFKEIHNLGLDKIEFTLKVPARRYDNKFLSVESDLIKEFCLWNCFNFDTQKVELDNNYKVTDNNGHTKTFNLQEYDELIKVIYNELKQTVKYIGLILNAEKKMVDGKKEEFLKALNEKYKGSETIDTFFLGFSENANSKPDRLFFENFIKQWDNKGLPNAEDLEEYLVNFRNFALHYQLQDPKRKEEIIKFLEDYTNYSSASKKEYTETE